MRGILLCSWIMIYILECFVRVDGATRSCPDDYLSFRGSCYHFGHTPYNFVESEQLGGHLVHIDSADENDYIKGQLEFIKSHEWWIGLIRVDGHFMWRNDNSSVTFTDWDIGQPNGGPNEWVAFYNPHQSYKWHDGPCDGGSSTYPICETSPPDRPAPIGK